MMHLENLLKLVQSGDLSIEEAMPQMSELLRSDLGIEKAIPHLNELPRNDQGMDKEMPHLNELPRNDQGMDKEMPHLNELPRNDQGIEDLGFAQLDIDRERRTGFPEVIYCEGKTPEQITAIIERMMLKSNRVLATRLDRAKAEHVMSAIAGLTYHDAARTLTWLKQPVPLPYEGYVAVVCAGTSDLPVAEEAAITCECMGSRVERVYDVGVAGIHRLFARLPVIRGANAVIVAAGMEGALVSVVGGLVAIPVIAVPTSVGYGASFHGMAALLAMLNSCAPGVSVVNIDNGFGAGYNAALINKNMAKRT